MSNFLMMVHKEHCTICQSYVEHVVDTLKGVTISILYPWIARVFCSTWPQSVTTIKDEVTVEADHKHNWYYDHCNNWARRAKIMEEKISSEKEQFHKAEVNLEASSSKKATLEELNELQRELKANGKCKESPGLRWSPITCKFHEWESATDSNVTEDTSLSRWSQK